MSAASKETLRSGAALTALLLISWQLLYWAIGEIALRSPAETMLFTVKYVGTNVFWLHLTETSKAFALALMLAAVIGLSLGFGLGLNRFSGEVLEPVLVAAYSVPKITLYPIILLMFGLGISAKVAFGTIHGVVPIALLTIGAVRNIRPVFLKAAQTMHLSVRETIFSIVLPSALPEIITGLRMGFALTLIGTLLGEMFASQRGLGFLLMNAIGLHNIDVIMAITVLLTLFAGSVSTVLLLLNRRIQK